MPAGFRLVQIRDVERPAATDSASARSSLTPGTVPTDFDVFPERGLTPTRRSRELRGTNASQQPCSGWDVTAPTGGTYPADYPGSFMMSFSSNSWNARNILSKTARISTQLGSFRVGRFCFAVSTFAANSFDSSRLSSTSPW